MAGRDQWFAVVRALDGELISVGTVVGDNLDKELELVSLPRKPNWSLDIWDSLTRSLIPSPPEPVPKDRVDDIMNDLTIKSLSILDQEKVRAVLTTKLPADARIY